MSDNNTFESFVSGNEEAPVLEVDEESSPVGIKRPRMEYRLVQEFETNELFSAYWEENKKGWQRKTKTANQLGDEIHLYM